MQAVQTIIASAPKGATPEPLRQTKAAIVVLAFCCLFPAFADDFIPSKLLVRRWADYGIESGSVNSSAAPVFNVRGEDDIYSLLSRSTFGLCINLLRREYNYGVVVPADTFGVVFPADINSLSITNSLYGTFNGTNCVASVARYDKIRGLYYSVAALYHNGYSGSGFDGVFPQGYKVCLNVNYPLLLADVLSSTNTVYRQILLGHLNAIQQSVANIEVNMSGVQSAVEQGNASLSNINLSVSDIRDVAGANSAVVSNISESAASMSSNSVDILRGVDLLHDDWLASSIDVFLGDDTEAWVNFLNIAVEQGLLSESDALQYESTLRATDPSRKKSYSIPDAHRRFFAKNSIKGTVVEAQQMRGRYQTFRNWTNQRGEMFGAMDATWNAIAGDRINSIMGAHVDDWRGELRQQLQDWKTSDERGILNVKKTIEDNFTAPDPRAPASSNSIPFTAFQTNFVTRPLTNAVQEASKQIQSNATANVDRQLEADDNRWDEFKSIATGDGEGLNVNIRSPLWEEGGFHVNVRDDAVVSAIQNLSAAPPPELVHISDAFDSFLGKYSTTNSLDWVPWFERWDPFSGIVTNFYSEYNSSRPAAEIARGYLSTGFDFSGYEKLPWFERVEVLLAMIADVGTNSVEVADIEEDMEDQVTAFRNLSTNVVSVSSDVVGLFDYVRRFSVSLDSMFGDKAAPLTGDYVLLPAGHWIGEEALVLRVNPAIQNLCRLIMQCIWYLGFLVLLWVVVNWLWQKVVAVLRWLWSMFDV